MSQFLNKFNKEPTIFIVIPAYNEEKHLGEILRKLKEKGYTKILVVDDGSYDRTEQICLDHQVFVVRHLINRGVGAATQTGLTAALRLGADIIVTIDADGQQDPEDIEKLVLTVKGGKADVAIGSRFLQHNPVPWIRRIYNFGGNIITWILSGIWLSDSQSGFKAFSRQAAQLIEINTNGFEFCSEIIREISWNKLRYLELPIKVYYSSHSLAKGQNFATGIRTVFKLILSTLMR